MYVDVKAIPNAKVDSVEIIGQNTYGHTIYKIKTTAQPEDDKANKAIRKLLAKYLWVSITTVVLKHGHTTRDKVFYIS